MCTAKKICFPAILMFRAKAVRVHAAFMQLHKDGKLPPQNPEDSPVRN